MQVLGQFLIPETIVVCEDRKSCPKIHCKTMNNFIRLLLPPERERQWLLPFPWLCIQAHTMLQQLQNLANNNTIHSYQTCLLLEFFSKNRCLNGSNVLFTESRVKDCLELNFRYVDYQPLAHLSYSYNYENYVTF